MNLSCRSEPTADRSTTPLPRSRRLLGVLGAAILAGLSTLAGAAEPARVLLLGSFHMANPGQDRINVEAADVLAPERQAQLQTVVDRLARFAPNRVAVEWPAEAASTAYAKYLADELPASRSEVVQIGFRLARQVGAKAVHGIDVPGPFPMDAVMAYAAETGRIGEIQAEMGQVMAEAAELGALSATDIPAALRRVNQRESLARGHSLYLGLMRYGAGERQPGVELMGAWTTRNLGMCARLVQALEPGDRAVLVVGSSHVEPIRECLRAMPAVEVEDAAEYL